MKQQTDEYEVIMRSIQRKQRNSGILYAFIPLCLVVIGLVYFMTEIDAKRQELQAAQKEFESLEGQVRSKKKELQLAETSLKSTQEELAVLNSELRAVKQSYAHTGTQPDSTVYLIQNQVRQAEKELDVFIRQQRIEPLQEVKIEYYERPSDEGLVSESLRRLGFTDIVVKESKVKYDLQPSNYIYYGSNVDVNKVKLIALALLGDGFDLKEIRPFRNGLNADIIQIGRKSSIFRKRSLTADDVNKLN